MAGTLEGLDGENATVDDKLAQLKQWVVDFEDETEPSRLLSIRDRKYFDGDQWTVKERAELKDAGLPALTLNKIAPKINSVVGGEIAGRVDPKAFPRTPEHDDDSEVVVDVLRYLVEKEDFDGHSTDMTSEMVVEGAHGIIMTTETVPGANGKTVDVGLREIPFDRLIWDPKSRKHDFSDALYMGLHHWGDIETEKNDPRYKKKEKVFEDARAAKSDTDSTDIPDDRPREWFISDRNRIKIVELYWKEVDEDGVTKWWGAHFTGAGMLVDPFVVDNEDDTEQHNNFCPIVADSAFVDGENNRYGIVRNLISPQDEKNHRRSKLLNEIGRRTIVYEEGAILDIDGALVQLAKAGGAIRVEAGTKTDKFFEILDRQDVIQGQVIMEQMAQQDLDQIGPSQALAGVAEQQGQSGRLFLARQEASRLELGPIMENIRRWKVRVYERLWWNARKFMTAETVLRVRDDDEKKGHRFFEINVSRGTKAERVKELIEKGVGSEEAVVSVLGDEGAEALRSHIQSAGKLAEIDAEKGGGEPISAERIEQAALGAVLSSDEALEPFDLNQIARLGVDIILETVNDSVTVRNEQFAEFMRALQGGAFQGMDPKVLLKTTLELSEWRFADKLIEEVEPSDEQKEQAAQQAQQQQQMQMQALELQMAQAQAEIEKIKADAALKAAQSQKAQAEAIVAQQTATVAIPAEAERDLAAAGKATTESENLILAPDNGAGASAP